ncbi:ribose 5-phosphate isomerase B [bacterium]|nr:MAG: ribose 5-phosphate isomerase B [bacterium]
MRNIVIASDHAGFILKEKLRIYLTKKGFAVKDLGTYSEDRCDYPVYAASLASLISKGKYKEGILICGSGIGVSIVANRFPGVRAALCYNVTIARLSREHNDSNVLVLGSRFVKPALARKIAGIWLNTKFGAGRHKKRLNLIKQIEEELKRK